MQIIEANIDHLDDIIHVNNFVDYGNPDWFMKQSIEDKRVLISMEGDIVTGFLLYQIIWGNTPFIALIKIHPDFQKQGLGSGLMQKFEEKLKQEGHTSYISSTGDDNTGSQIFHRKMNLDQIGTLNMSFGGEIFFRKEIS